MTAYRLKGVLDWREPATDLASFQQTGDSRGEYGFGRSAHGSDPRASYGFGQSDAEPAPFSISDYIMSRRRAGNEAG